MYYLDHDPWSWRSNRIGWVEKTFSSLEANYVWYTTWSGSRKDSRIVILPRENAKEMNVALHTFIKCKKSGTR